MSAAPARAATTLHQLLDSAFSTWRNTCGLPKGKRQKRTFLELVLSHIAPATRGLGRSTWKTVGGYCRHCIPVGPTKVSILNVQFFFKSESTARLVIDVFASSTAVRALVEKAAKDLLRPEVLRLRSVTDIKHKFVTGAAACKYKVLAETFLAARAAHGENGRVRSLCACHQCPCFSQQNHMLLWQ
jgi:hypothetical protein